MPAKTVRLEMRLTPELKDTFETAAALSCQPVSTLLLNLALPGAQRIIQEHHVTKLSLADMRRFVEILDSPPEPTPALKKAVKRWKERHAR